MYRILTYWFVFCLAGCASFDKTNIPPGQAIQGPGFSFEAPTENNWFAAEYGTSHRIKLVQLNDEDSYTILVSMNRGPRWGMYPTAEDHLRVMQRHKRLESQPAGYVLLDHDEWLAKEYGHLCVRYSSRAKDWRGRNKQGPALIDIQGLTCEHGSIKNVLISFELSHRYEESAIRQEIDTLAHQLFQSIEFHSLQ